MKFQPDTADGRNLVARFEPATGALGPRLWAGTQAPAPLYETSVIVPWQGAIEPWGAATLAELTPEHFARLVARRPELVIFGSGARLRFVPAALQRALIEARIGVETMDTAAACRTYNVLASEHRNVVAALLLEAAPARALESG
jgi:uncharacterized protein